jgi:hypothetical protein
LKSVAPTTSKSSNAYSSFVDGAVNVFMGITMVTLKLEVHISKLALQIIAAILLMLLQW